MDSEGKNTEVEDAHDGAEAERDADVGDTADARLEDETQDAQAKAPPAEGEVGGAEEGPVDPVEQLKAAVTTLEDSLLRAKADYQNLQRRSALAQSEAIRYANAELMRSLLGVVDDFERSLEAAQQAEDASPIVAGVRLVHENLMKALRVHGLETIEAVDQPFDPHVHEAIMQQSSQDHPPGTVVQQIAKGYRLRGRILRPAKVIVSKDVETDEKKEPEGPAGKAGQEDGKRKKSKKRD